MENPEILLSDLMATDAWIRTLSRRLVTNHNDAEDVAQDAWVRTLTARPSLQRGSQLWLFKVVRNLVVSQQRSITRRNQRERAVFRRVGTCS
jgi:DNA-directed RNA polymerase specialized sigma24 family protein